MVAGTVGIAVTSSGGAATVQGYSGAVSACSVSSLTYQFSDSGDTAWQPAWRDRAREGFNSLNGGGLNSSGNSLVSVVEGSGSGIPIKLEDLPGTQYGVARCNGGNPSEIVFDSPSAASFSNSQWWHAAGHEMMHQLGAEHSSGDEAPLPRMATCAALTNVRSTSNMTNEDVANLTWLHDPKGGRQITPRGGFEDASFTSTWVAVGDVFAFERTTSMVIDGSSSLNLNMPSVLFDTNYIETSAVRYLQGDNNREFKGTGRFQVENTTFADGFSMMTVYARPVTYTAGAMTCEYPLGLENYNVNAAPAFGPWVAYAHSNQALGTSVTTQETPDFTVGGHGAEFRLRIRAAARGGPLGGYIHLSLDNAYVEEA